MTWGVSLHFCRYFIEHYWSATRIDVLHSPFIFDLYCTCIKPKAPLPEFVAIDRKSNGLSKRTLGIIFRMVKKFRYGSCLEIGECPGSMASFSRDNYFCIQNMDHLSETLYSLSSADLILMNTPLTYSYAIKPFEQIIDKVHNDSVIILTGIHKNKEMTKIWDEVKNHPKVTVTVDLLFIGMVFFRREQARQHFKLRLF